MKRFPNKYRRIEGTVLPRHAGPVVDSGGITSFRCPCFTRQICVFNQTHPETKGHQVSWDANGLLTIQGSLGALPTASYPKEHWCHGDMTGGVFSLHDDSICPGATNKFASIGCTFDNDVDDWMFEDEVPAGTFGYDRRESSRGPVSGVYIKLPYEHPAGIPADHFLPFYREGEAPPESPSWLLTGTSECPTLRPSIACGPQDNLNWHGYLTDGVLKACE